MSLRVSVVVPTYKHPDYLERCLKALCTLHFPPEDYEIVVVDDAASQETRQQVETFAQAEQARERSIRYLPISGTKHGPARARNCGWRSSYAEIIAFTDDDCIPEMNWLQNGVQAFTTETDGISGRVIVPLPALPTDYELNAAGLEHSQFVTANCFYRRKALELAGGFDEHFTGAWREDSDLLFTLLEKDAVCIAEPTAIVLRPVRPARWGSSLRQQRKSLYDALLYKKHPHLYRQYIQRTPPWKYYCISGCLLLLAAALILHLWLLAILALLAWSYMTLRFSIARLHKTSRRPRHVLEMLVTSMIIPPLAIFWRLWGAIKYHTWFL